MHGGVAVRTPRTPIIYYLLTVAEVRTTSPRLIGRVAHVAHRIGQCHGGGDFLDVFASASRDRKVAKLESMGVPPSEPPLFTTF